MSKHQYRKMHKQGQMGIPHCESGQNGRLRNSPTRSIALAIFSLALAAAPAQSLSTPTRTVPCSIDADCSQLSHLSHTHRTCLESVCVYTPYPHHLGARAITHTTTSTTVAPAPAHTGAPSETTTESDDLSDISLDNSTEDEEEEAAAAFPKENTKNKGADPKVLAIGIGVGGAMGLAVVGGSLFCYYKKQLANPLVGNQSVLSIS